jgi:HEAT repeat protein
MSAFSALSSHDVRQRRAAVRALADAPGPIPAGDVDHLVELLRDPDEAVRDAAADALLKIASTLGPARDRLLGGLGTLLRQGDDLLRLRIVNLIGRIGPLAAPLVPGLIAGLTDRNRVLCRVSAEALCRIGPAAVPALEAALVDPRGRAAARWVLGRIAEAGQAADTVLQVKQATTPSIRVEVPAAAPRRRGPERRQNPRYP